MKSLFMIAVLILSCCVGVSSAATYTVCDDGSTDYSNYSDVVSLLAPGDIVEFCDGTYVQSEDVVVAGVTLCSLSGNPEACIINLGNNTVRMSGVSVLQGLTVTGGYLGVLGLPYAEIHINHCMIDSNRGNFTVGGIRVAFGSLIISNSRITNNAGTQSGSDSAGGISSLLCDLTMSDTVVSGNSSANSGGAVNVIAGQMTATNCVFSGNQSEGGAIQLDGSLSLVSCTVTANSSAGLNVGSGFQSLSLDRVLMWGNCDTDFMASGAGYTASCCLIGCFFDGFDTHCDGPDPLFCESTYCFDAPTDGGDFHLTPTSPAVSYCGLVGAYGVSCDTVSTRSLTWGLIKSLYR